MKLFLLSFFWLACTSNQTQISILKKIQENKKIIVGITGDYQPFSFWNPKTKDYEGIDIELAKKLAKSLGAQLEFYKTSWPTLLKDLKDQRFDIAMGGISKTSEREKAGLFSETYYTDGKTPIALCRYKNNYKNLIEIDKPKIKVIVNPGGTNFSFAKNNIKKATLIVHPDNTTIFNELLNKKADVMITDGIEVKLQTKRHPELCATMKGTFNHIEKAYLLPSDTEWKNYLDKWLLSMNKKGIIGNLFKDF